MNSIPTFLESSINNFDWYNISDEYPVKRNVQCIPFNKDSNNSGLFKSNSNVLLFSFSHFSFVFGLLVLYIISIPSLYFSRYFITWLPTLPVAPINFFLTFLIYYVINQLIPLIFFYFLIK